MQGNGNAGWSIFVKDVISGGDAVLVALPPQDRKARLHREWSPDGKYMLYQEQDGPKGGRIEAQPLSGNGKPFVVAAPPVVRWNYFRRLSNLTRWALGGL